MALLGIPDGAMDGMSTGDAEGRLLLVGACVIGESVGFLEGEIVGFCVALEVGP